MKSKISVIVPAFNSESTIAKALESILDQTYSNIEIIVIKDGSTDNTQAVIKELMESDNRIKLISIPNGGVSNARNTGIDNATGDFVTFVDSDDTIERDMYEHLMGLFAKYDVDIAHCSYNTVFSNGKICPVGNMGKEVIQSRDEAIDCLISGKLFAGGLCNKVYKIHLFDGVRLDSTIKFNEDGLMNFHLFSRSKKSVYSDRALYNYYQCENSSTHTANRIKAATDKVKVAEEILKNSIGESFELSAKRRLAGVQLGLFGVYSMDKKIVDKTSIKNLEKEIINWKNKGLYSRNEKIKILMFRFFPWIYKVLYIGYDKIRVKKLDPEQ